MIKFPDNVLDTVRQLLHAEGSACWGIGDIVNLIAEQQDQPVALVARHLAYETGGNDHTFRDYAYVSGRIPDDWREELPLTRHQWKACMSAGDECFTVALWAVEQADTNGGRPMSVRAIRAHIAGVSESEFDFDADDYTRKQVDRARYTLTTIAYDERLPGWLCDAVRRWLAELESLGAEGAHLRRVDTLAGTPDAHDG